MIHLIRLCVGVDAVEELEEFQRDRGPAPGRREGSYTFTKRAPTRLEELLDGGSLYWVIRGQIKVRQAVLGVTRGEDRCRIDLGPIRRTVPRHHGPFQGWRYFKPDLAPPDVEGDGPAEMLAELKALGLI